MKFARISWIAFLSLTVLSPLAWAQWPAHISVRIVVPFAAGGIGDVLMRLLAQEVSEKSDRTIWIEDRPGAGSIIGTEMVARAAPDGTTLLTVGNSFLINSSVKADLPYDPLTSFTPICALALSPMVFVVNRKSNYDSSPATHRIPSQSGRTAPTLLSIWPSKPSIKLVTPTCNSFRLLAILPRSTACLEDMSPRYWEIMGM
jgi:tripartite-type tricarboxylate transporter receptor subunit TctC